MLEPILYTALGIWITGTVLLFAHEVWVYYKRPMDWERRHDGLNVIADWQVWLIMVFWPFVLVAYFLLMFWEVVVRGR